MSSYSTSTARFWSAGAGDISLQTGTSNADALQQALVQLGVPAERAAQWDDQVLRAEIEEHHQRGKQRGIQFPEVDIVEVWRAILRKIEESVETLTVVDPGELAVEYEVRVNPVWPMPGLRECVTNLHSSGFQLGVISNAQAMTPQLFPALLGETLEGLGFDRQLQFFSYRFGESKPGLSMFRAAVEELAQRGCPPNHAVYIGNDMLNDVWAAQQVGFRTILFAGDARSLPAASR